MAKEILKRFKGLLWRIGFKGEGRVESDWMGDCNSLL